MVLEAAVAMALCDGAVTGILGGFSADALRDRINDCQARVALLKTLACVEADRFL